MGLADSESPEAGTTRARTRAGAKRSPPFSFRLPTRRDRELIEDLRTVAAEQEISASALLRWILRQTLQRGVHPSRVSADLLVARRRRHKPEPLPTPAPPPVELTVPSLPARHLWIGPRDERAALEAARERRQLARLQRSAG